MDMDTSTKRDPFEVLGQFLEEDGWYPQSAEGVAWAYRFPVEAEYDRFSCLVQIRPEWEVLLVYVISSVAVAPERVMALVEMINRLNHKTVIGNLELDSDSYEVRFRTSVGYEGVGLTPALITNTIYPAVETLDKFTPYLEAVADGAATPEEAMAELIQDTQGAA